MAERRKSRHALSSAQRAELAEAFACFDRSASNAIELFDLRVLLRSLGFDFGMEDLREEVLAIDADCDGFVGFDVFVEIVSMRFLDREPEEHMMNAFHMFKPGSNGLVTVESLREVAEEIGAEVTDDDLQAMIENFASPKSGGIDEDTFVDIMKSSTLA